MGKKLSTWYSQLNDDYCEVHFDYKEEYAYIKYFNSGGKIFFTEDFKGKSIHYVNDAADNWTTGIKKLDKKRK